MNLLSTACFTITRIPIAASLLCCLWATSSLAADISTKQYPNFTRLSIGGPAANGMKIEPNGNILTLRLPTGSGISAAEIKSSLGDKLQSITALPGDGGFTVTLNKAYRVRQFISSSGAGFDILSSPSSDPTKAAAPAAPNPILTTKKPALPAVAEKPAPKKPAETKPEAAPKLPDARIAPAPKPETKPIATPAAETPTPPTPATTSGDDRTMLVGVQADTLGSKLIFPWQSRVAASIFTRGDEGWVVFSKPTAIDTTQLSSILPPSLLGVTQYQSPNHTVLQFKTDGKSVLSASQIAGRFDWIITLSNAAKPLNEAYEILPVTDDDAPYLLVNVYESAEPLSFIDPTHKDRITAIPTFEPSQALAVPYANPQLTVIPAAQGIVLQPAIPQLTIKNTREGLRILSKDGFAVSPRLPTSAQQSAPQAMSKANVMLPYAQWKVDAKDFHNARMTRAQTLADATFEAKPAALYDLVGLYMGQGMAEEALSLLTSIQSRYPDYYRTNQLALIRAAANFMTLRMGEAAGDITSPELATNPEAKLWKQAIGIFVPQILATAPSTATATESPAPASKPAFDFLGFENNYIRFYPPSIRQRLAIIAADTQISDGEFSKAARALESLNTDDLLEEVQLYGEFLLGKIAADSQKIEQAITLWEPLTKQEKNLFIKARATFALATLRYNNGKASLDDTIKTLDKLRIMWRGDTLEQSLLSYLGQLYFDNKDYAEALRTWKEYVTNYGATFEGITLSKRMSELYEDLFSRGLADEMPPLQSLALFYEFQDLKPIGARGDEMMRKLADRLARLDLLDRAAALLEHQVKYRLEGESRSRAGAQLATLQLLNRSPKKALKALELSSYGGSDLELASDRNRLTAKALSLAGKPAVALELLTSDRSPVGQQLRMEILWDMKDWPNVINVAEDILGNRPQIAAPLNPNESELLLKLALAYSFERDSTQLKYLRDYYTPLLAESPFKDIFSYITNDAAPLSAEEFGKVTQQINNSESFLKTFRDKIAKGQLSTIGMANPESEETTDEPSISEQNRPLVPESQEPVTTLPQAADVPIVPNTPGDAPERAPIAVEDAPATPSAGATAAPTAEAPAAASEAPAPATPPPSQTAPQ